MNAIPVVPGVPVFGSLLDARRDRIELQHRVGRAHDLARLKFGFYDALMISSPELAHELLVENEDAFVKTQGLTVFARPLLGDGLLTSEGELHKRQRRMMAPLFAPKHIALYADVMAERAERAANRMIELGTCDVSAESMRVTLEIVGKTLFGAELGGEADAIGDALTEAMERMMYALTSLVPLPPIVPTPSNLRMRRAVTRLDATVTRLVRERREHPDPDRVDVLSLLLAARDEDGSAMNDKQVRDEAMTIFLAGHETTANALAWSLYLLGQSPDVRDRAVREIDAALEGRTPTRADLERMPYVLQVLKESMRLYPPAYIIGRRATRDVTIGGHRVRRGQILFVNIAGIHRRADPWEDPERFDPDRFTPEREKVLPRHAYMPFGAGSRICIGNHFALMEGHILLATILQRVRLELASRKPVGTEALITLRPKDGVWMRASRR